VATEIVEACPSYPFWGRPVLESFAGKAAVSSGGAQQMVPVCRRTTAMSKMGWRVQIFLNQILWSKD
jgi:hypothetical protein